MWATSYCKVYKTNHNHMMHMSSSSSSSSSGASLAGQWTYTVAVCTSRRHLEWSCARFMHMSAHRKQAMQKKYVQIEINRTSIGLSSCLLYQKPRTTDVMPHAKSPVNAGCMLHGRSHSERAHGAPMLSTFLKRALNLREIYKLWQLTYEKFAHFVCVRRYRSQCIWKQSKTWLSVSFGSLEIYRFYT